MGEAPGDESGKDAKCGGEGEGNEGNAEVRFESGGIAEEDFVEDDADR